jgi:hypothetical protein
LNPATEPNLPERSHLHRRLFWLVLALVAYGSLFPFRYQAHLPSWADGWALLRPETRHSRSDLLGNVLLFVPYGLLLAAPMLLRRRMLALLGGAALALGLQYLQFWFPDRDPIGTDAVLNVVVSRSVWVGGFVWIPFAGSLGGDPIAAVPPLIEKLSLYGSLVFFVRYLGASHWLTVLTLGAFLLALELAQ